MWQLFVVAPLSTSSLHQSNKSPWITRNDLRRCAGVGVGLVGAAFNAASINSAVDHARSVIPSACGRHPQRFMRAAEIVEGDIEADGS
jgi:hypothetical protein